MRTIDFPPFGCSMPEPVGSGRFYFRSSRSLPRGDLSCVRPTIMHKTIRCFIAFSVAVLLFIVGGCETHTEQQTVAANGTEIDEMSAAQTNLDQTLQKHSPFVFKRLGAPATDSEIARLRAALAGLEVDDLESWFRWHNGWEKLPTKLLPLGAVVSIDQAIEDRSAYQLEAFVSERRKRNIKVLDDGAGDGFFVDLSATPPRIYYEMMENPVPKDFGTVIEFLQFIDRVHSAGITSLNEYGVVDFDEASYNKLELEHLEKIESGAQ